MKNSNEQQRVDKILRILNKKYPDPRPFLHFKTPWQLLVATVLAAQCTDERVNKVTSNLFAVAPTPKKLSQLSQKKLTDLIRTIGLYRSKTKNLRAAATMVIQRWHNNLPQDLSSLQQIPGVGRKTASVVLCQAFGIPAFPVDRHVFRIANRLALVHAKTSEKTDMQLRTKIPRTRWKDLHLQLIMLGRELCRPHPFCNICPLLPHCPTGKKNIRKHML